MSVITKEDLVTLGLLALEYGKASRARGEILGYGFSEQVSGLNLISAEQAEFDRWDAYMKLHRDLIKRLEGKDSPQLESTAERPKITTVGELDALPSNSVVMEEGNHGVYLKEYETHWSADGRSYDSGQIDLPATLIWRPEE